MDFLKNISPREYQQKIFESCSKENCLVVLPTGLGKTLIALMLSIDRIKKFPGEKIVFLAPTKPLAEQHLGYFTKNLPELFAEITLFTGEKKADERKKLWQNSEIVFSTPQCIANDLRNNLYSMNDVCLLIEDEAHRCIKNYDYNFVAKKYKEQSVHQRIIGLTASPGSDESKIREICKNLSITCVELRSRDSDDVKKYLQDLEFEKVKVEFPSEFEEMRKTLQKIFNEFVEDLRVRGVLYGSSSKTDLIKLQKNIMGTISRGNKNWNYLLGASSCAQAIKIQHALELLETQTLLGFNKYLKDLIEQARKKQSRGVEKLVRKPEFNFVYEQSNEFLAKNFEHPKIGELIKIIYLEIVKDPKTKIILFTQFRETASIVSERINKIPGIKSKIFIGQAKKNGIGLSQKEQKKIIEDFSSGEINVLCATCIAEEGLDIPEVNTVIFYEPVASAIRTIQRTGRTARLMKGKLIILMTEKTRDESFFYVSKSREKKMKTAIENVKDKIKYPEKYETQKELKI